MLPIEKWQDAELKTAAERTDLKVAADNVGVARYMSEDPYTMLKMQQLRHVVQSGRHLGRQHVCGRRRRHPAEQGHVEAQLPLRPAT